MLTTTVVRRLTCLSEKPHRQRRPGRKTSLFCAGVVYRTAQGKERFGLLSSFGGVPIISTSAHDLFQEIGHLGHVYALHPDLRRAKVVMVSDVPGMSRPKPRVWFSLEQRFSVLRSVRREETAMSCP